MKQVTFAPYLLLMLTVMSGCSVGKLSRREASHKIDAMLKPHPVGHEKILTSGVPGFSLSSGDHQEPPFFHVTEHEPYDKVAFEQNEKDSPNDEDYIVDALDKMGYISVQEEGPKTMISYGTPLPYSHSRTVRFTDRVGTVTATGYSKDYSSGFSCYPKPDFAQCNLPALIEMGSGYQVTGIVQDETHAKVNLLIPWKLTTFGLQLKPYAASIQAQEAKLGENSGYSRYSDLYGWEHFLNSHAESGESPAMVLFQKFDDGWRIVDEDGKSEKDFN